MAQGQHDYIIIAAPISSNGADRDRQRLLQDTTAKDLSYNHAFPVPALKVGTLNSLVLLSDDLAKVDQLAEAVTYKLSQYMSDLIGKDEQDKLRDRLLVSGKTADDFLCRFAWDHAKYKESQSVSDLSKEFAKRISTIELEMKGKIQAYNKVKGNLQALERKANGSLLIRSLSELVAEKYFVRDSEFLVTLLVVVPKSMVKDWYEKYEKLCDLIVPRSTEAVTDDNEFVLFTVTLFRKMVDDFKAAARENRFVVRDFEFQKEDIEEEQQEKGRLRADISSRFNVLVEWCSVSFNEAFAAWVHIKCLRVFVESVLRYGLPVNFQAYVMLPFNGKKKALRSALARHYSHLDSNPFEGDIDVPGMATVTHAEYFPYVSFDVDVGKVSSLH